MLGKEDNNLSIRHQAKLLEVSRSKIYYQNVMSDDSIIANQIADIYGESDCRYGYRKVHDELVETGNIINKKQLREGTHEPSYRAI